MITARALERCERCGNASSDMQAHHRRARGMGGTKRADTNTAAGGVLLCGDCHRRVESERMQAYRDGWLVRQHQTPAAVPVLRRGEWVNLDDDGSYLRAVCRCGHYESEHNSLVAGCRARFHNGTPIASNAATDTYTVCDCPTYEPGGC